MRLTHVRTPWRGRIAGRRSRYLRAAAITVALVALLLTAGVAFAQSSAGYDLACRGAFTSNGGLLTAPSNTYGILGAFGQSPAGESESPSYGIYGGYVQPGADRGDHARQYSRQSSANQPQSTAVYRQGRARRPWRLLRLPIHLSTRPVMPNGVASVRSALPVSREKRNCMEPSSTIAVLGASHSGFGLAAELALRGISVRLYELPEFADAFAPVTARGGIELTGVRGAGFAPVPTTLDPAEALRNVSLIFCTVPAYGHERMVGSVLPFLKDGDLLAMTGGAPFSALAAAANSARRKKEALPSPKPPTSSLPAPRPALPPCGLRGPSAIYPWPRCHPAWQVSRSTRLQAIYPEHVAAANVLETSLSNVNLSLHPAMLLCNAGRIETFGGGWPYFVEGLTPSVARLVETLDAERLAITDCFDMPRRSSSGMARP